MRLLLLLLALVVGVQASERASFKELAPPVLPAPPPDHSNRFSDDPRAARLGQRFFFDPAFSGRLLDTDNNGGKSTLGKFRETGKVACSGCHIPQSGFVDSRSPGGMVSLAAGWGFRKAPSLLDVAQNKLFMWDGRKDTLYNQIFGVIESPLEMNSSRLFVAQQLARNYREPYEAVFGELPAFDDPKQFPQLSAQKTGCFPRFRTTPRVCNGTMHGLPGDLAEYDSLSKHQKAQVDRAVVNMGKAIAAYERLLRCGPGRFDRWVNGDSLALSPTEQRGAEVFVGKGQCLKCHSGPYLSDFGFHNVGLVPRHLPFINGEHADPGAFRGLAEANQSPLNSRGIFSDQDDGRLPHRIPDSLLGAMKTPMLRCLGSRKGFMHTGQIRDLEEVVDFFDHGGRGKVEIGISEIRPLGLSGDEKKDLAAFLRSLDGPGPAASLLSP